MKYEIPLVALANVSTLVTVEADSPEEADAKAVQKALDGYVVWNYDGISSDSTIEPGE